MRLFELEDPLRVRLVAVTNQIKDDIDKGQGKSDWTMGEFLSYLQDQGINLSEDDLYDMYKKPPLNTIIQNIEAGNIIFKGQESSGGKNPDEQESQQVVQQMASNAMK